MTATFQSGNFIFIKSSSYFFFFSVYFSAEKKEVVFLFLNRKIIVVPETPEREQSFLLKNPKMTTNIQQLHTLIVSWHKTTPASQLPSPPNKQQNTLTTSAPTPHPIPSHPIPSHPTPPNPPPDPPHPLQLHSSEKATGNSWLRFGYRSVARCL